jgi:cysteine desulfurase
VSAEYGDPAVAPRVHLDAASGLPLHPRAREVWLAAIEEGWADPLRLHSEGRTARVLLDNAREVIAEIIRCRPDELSFTPSGTTASQLGVLGLRRGRDRVGPTIVHSAVEHSAVMQACAWNVSPVTTGALPTSVGVGVDAFGQIELGAWSRAVAAPGVAAACLQAANHEVGTIQPLVVAAELCRSAGVPLLVDACATVGWSSVPEQGDVLVASAHKWGGPPGVGLLVIRKGTRWRAPWPTDEREVAAAGFTNVAAVLAAAAALQEVDAQRPAAEAAMRRMTGELRREILSTIPDVDVAGHPDARLPHIVNFSCLYVEGEALVTELDLRGFAVSSGSACSASTQEPSHVLAAMGVLTHGNVRVSIAPTTTPEELRRFLDAVASIVPRLRASTGIIPATSPFEGRHRGTHG